MNLPGIFISNHPEVKKHIYLRKRSQFNMKFFLTVSLIVAFMAMVCADELNDEKGAFTVSTFFSFVRQLLVWATFQCIKQEIWYLEGPIKSWTLKNSLKKVTFNIVRFWTFLKLILVYLYICKSNYYSSTLWNSFSPQPQWKRQKEKLMFWCETSNNAF